MLARLTHRHTKVQQLVVGSCKIGEELVTVLGIFLHGKGELNHEDGQVSRLFAATEAAENALASAGDAHAQLLTPPHTGGASCPTPEPAARVAEA